MSTEQLPDDLQMAYEFARAVWPVAGTTADKRMSASDAIRTEHTKRLTLQHHACDLAQRVADLEAERDELIDQRDRGDAQNDLLLAELRQVNTERDEWKRIASAYSTQKELSKALEQAKASGRQARNERDDLRTKYDELLVALHGIGAALGIPEGDRSPYSVTCGVLERVNRLAEIEAQEPVAISKAGNLFWAGNPQDWRGVDCSLFASPVPAQAVPESVDGLVSVFCYDEVLTFTFCDEAAADRFAGRFDPSVDSAEAPEHKA